MEIYQERFLRLAMNMEGVLSQPALLFGQFTLKSGRQSPYFFQSGAFNNGEALNQLGELLAHTINYHKPQFDHLFGPAYKGIPLVSATAIALSNHYQQNYPWSFNRKAEKDHGEGGQLVGAALQGNLLIIDDVLTAGTAISESIRLVKKKNHHINVSAIITLLDRCEILSNGQNAKTLIQDTFHIPVYSIVSIYHVIEFLKAQQREQEVQAIENHLKKYGE